MTESWTVPTWLPVLALVVLVLLVLVALLAARRAASATAELRLRVAEIERTSGDDDGAHPQPSDAREYVITRLGDASPATSSPAPVLPPAVFADMVLREGAVQTVALVHGLRRALSPQSRNRIRFAVRQEVKRSRKTRKAQEREALRAWQARRRAGENAA